MAVNYRKGEMFALKGMYFFPPFLQCDLILLDSITTGPCTYGGFVKWNFQNDPIGMLQGDFEFPLGAFLFCLARITVYLIRFKACVINQFSRRDRW
jgi:hypothetical protein